MKNKLDRICTKVVTARTSPGVPPGFAGRVMAHVRERAELALDGWFMRRVAVPIMASGGAAALGLGLGWAWLWQAGYTAELSLLISGHPLAGF